MSMMQPDWHPADIIAGLKKKGTSLAAVSRRSGWPPPRWQTPLIAAGPEVKG
ncbi:transcriptional regulator [Salmonella enterica subsp. arizonae]|uniref:Transcriptional regulator n=1 Tax=Salmonella enterica subsp. arizonae TaxID=59203 RepID=A0A2X4TJU3_SALER|nr:transcriptional regulator [Salmonella enterica subsp. arizonae]